MQKMYALPIYKHILYITPHTAEFQPQHDAVQFYRHPHTHAWQSVRSNNTAAVVANFGRYVADDYHRVSTLQCDCGDAGVGLPGFTNRTFIMLSFFCVRLKVPCMRCLHCPYISASSPFARCPLGVSQGLRFLRESQHAGQRFVDGFGGGECLLDFGLQNNDIASLHELLVILAPHANPKLLAFQFWNILIILACRCFFHIGSPFAH